MSRIVDIPILEKELNQETASHLQLKVDLSSKLTEFSIEESTFQLFHYSPRKLINRSKELERFTLII